MKILPQQKKKKRSKLFAKCGRNPMRGVRGVVKARKWEKGVVPVSHHRGS